MLIRPWNGMNYSFWKNLSPKELCEWYAKNNNIVILDVNKLSKTDTDKSGMGFGKATLEVNDQLIEGQIMSVSNTMIYNGVNQIELSVAFTTISPNPIHVFR